MKTPFAQPPKLPNNRIAVDFDAYFKPTWKQRLQLLIGYTILINSKVFIDRKNEQVKAGSSMRLSDKLTAEEQRNNHAV
jgi:hypothetical protein